MRAIEGQPSPFIPVGTGDGGKVMVRASAYGLALDFNGVPYLDDRHGSLLLGDRVYDFVICETEGRA